MSYCIKCGVELGPGEEKCPLCHTPVCHPDVKVDPTEKPFPPQRRDREEPVNRSGVLFILTMLFAIPLSIALLCDLLLNDGLTWFPYVLGSMLFLYVVLVLPLWFHRPNPVIFVPVDFAALALLLLSIDLCTGGHWFLPFALPVTGGAMVIVTTVVALIRYVRRGYLYIAGGAIIATGGYTMLIELQLNNTFHIHSRLLWSYFPMAACFLLGMALIIVAICPKMRQSLHKKFFL